jgi:hypothetical protein
VKLPKIIFLISPILLLTILGSRHLLIQSYNNKQLSQVNTSQKVEAPKTDLKKILALEKEALKKLLGQSGENSDIVYNDQGEIVRIITPEPPIQTSGSILTYQPLLTNIGKTLSKTTTIASKPLETTVWASGSISPTPTPAMVAMIDSPVTPTPTPVVVQPTQAPVQITKPVAPKKQVKPASKPKATKALVNSKKSTTLAQGAPTVQAASVSQVKEDRPQENKSEKKEEKRQEKEEKREQKEDKKSKD